MQKYGRRKFGKRYITHWSMLAVLLRLEVMVLATATAVYFLSGYQWWVFLLLFAPDLSALGYLAGPRIGSVCYNAVHTIIGPLLLGFVGWQLGSGLALQLALIWLAHIGLDRVLGFGLKYPDAFKHTHLDAI
ncbi:MAG: DUF4260 domain-containing protein [Chloroflexota bacterium]